MSREMTYRPVGRSGLLVSRIGLGTMNFGYTVDESSSFAVMDAAIVAGINFFDTADVYGGAQSPDMKKGYGIAEETVGRWLQRSGHRDDIVPWPRRCTSRWDSVQTTADCRPTTFGARARRACGGCRPITSPVPDAPRRPVTPWEEIRQAMEQLVREGKISYVGSSNFAAWDVALAQSAASARHSSV